MLYAKNYKSRAIRINGEAKSEQISSVAYNYSLVLCFSWWFPMQFHILLTAQIIFNFTIFVEIKSCKMEKFCLEYLNVSIVLECFNECANKCK